MAKDKIKPLKMESPASGGTEVDEFPTETNNTEDYVDTFGVVFKGNDNLCIDVASDGSLQFTDINFANKKFKDLGSSLTNLDGGSANSVYGGVTGIDSGGA